MTAQLPIVAAAVHHGGWWWWFPLVPLFFFGFWFLLFAVVGRRWAGHRRPSAEEVLAERFARGEIGETEFMQRRAVLRRKD